MDIPTIAATATSFLVPALPYLATAGEKGAEVLGEKLGAGAWETAKAIWQKLSPAMEASPSATEAAQEVVSAPDDPDAQAALRHQLKKILAADASLASALVQLLEAAGPTSYHAEVHGDGAIAQGGGVAAGKGGVAVGGDVHDGVRTGGTEFIGTQVKRES
jgi:hypothetical protein